MASNETVLHRAYAASLRGDDAAMAACVADDVVAHFPGRSKLAGDHQGRGALRRRVFELTGGVLEIEPHDMLESDDHAVGIYTMRVTTPDRSIEWRHVNVYHVRDGQVVEAWHHPFELHAVDEFFS